MTRFPTGGHYATYNATAPIEASSGGHTGHRLNVGGNRVLNHAIHIAAVTQLGHDTNGRTYYDNAMAEALNGTFKAELISLHGPWKTRHQTEIEIIEWIDWYNNVRLHGQIRDFPPAEKHVNHYRHRVPAANAGAQ